MRDGKPESARWLWTRDDGGEERRVQRRWYALIADARAVGERDAEHAAEQMPRRTTRQRTALPSSARQSSSITRARASGSAVPNTAVSTGSAHSRSDAPISSARSATHVPYDPPRPGGVVHWWAWTRAMDVLRDYGMLLQSARGPIPNVAELVAGEPISEAGGAILPRTRSSTR